MKNPKVLVKNEVPRSIRAQLFPLFETGAKAYYEIINTNKEFINSVFLNNIKGNLFNYLIFRQFEPDMINNNFPFKFEAKTVNNFKYRSLNLVRPNSIINIGKAFDKDSLPNRSLYRRKLCKHNNFREKNLLFAINNDNKLCLKSSPYYMFLTYGYNYKKFELEFVNLVIPDKKMKDFIYKIDIKSEYALHRTLKISREEKRETEKKIAFLKEDVIKQFNIFKGIDGHEN